MKSCTKGELELPTKTLIGWLRERFSELPPDTIIVSAWASSMVGGPPSMVKIEVEHSHVDTDAEKEPKSDGQ